MVMKTNTSDHKAALEEDDVEKEIKEAGKLALRLHFFQENGAPNLEYQTETLDLKNSESVSDTDHRMPIWSALKCRETSIQDALS